MVQVTRVPPFTVRRLGLNGPPPPVIATLEIAVASQLGMGLGLGDGLPLGDGLALGEGLALGLGEALGLGDGLTVGNGVGLGDGFGPPTTVMFDRTPLRASSICTVPE